MSALRAEIRRLDAASRRAGPSPKATPKMALARPQLARPRKLNPALHLGLSWAAQMSRLPATAKFLIGWGLPPLR